jgi:sugar O-acyltransferase (sialic acid O-acetyltransferase NeuD family)
MINVIIFGAGQVGSLTQKILNDHGEFNVLGFVDDNVSSLPAEKDGLPIFGGRKYVMDVSDDISYCIGAGHIKVRCEIFQWLVKQNKKIASAIHPTAKFFGKTAIGQGLTVAPNCSFFDTVSIGNGCYFGPNVSVSHDSKIGNFCLVSQASIIGARVNIEDNVFVGTGSTIVPKYLGASELLSVGHHSTIGAGSLVLENVPIDTVVKGRPAKAKS